MARYVVTVGQNDFALAIASDGDITLDGERIAPDIQQLDTRTYSVLFDGTSYNVIAEKSDGVVRLLVNGSYHEAMVESERSRLLKSFDAQSATGHRRMEIHAPMPALVVKVEVGVGDEVTSGQGLIILEAMKMENEIKSHSAGKVREIFVEKGAAVEKGELLIILE